MSLMMKTRTLREATCHPRSPASTGGSCGSRQASGCTTRAPRRSVRAPCERRPAGAARSCTLAVIAAAAESVKVHDRTFEPPLEHAPDQMAERPLLTLSVIDVPTANGAEPLEPVATRMPAGLDVTRSPPRPEAVTVSAAVCARGAAGVTVSAPVLLAPLNVAVITTAVLAETAEVVMVNVPVKPPVGAVTLAGTLAASILLRP